ncbi:MAG: GtrA family protein [Oscillospiraceae bacterium]|nr:GtrA family protein [Oscillospiraceae bacterium]
MLIKNLFNKYRHLIIYVFFGAVTTAVNFAVYYPLYNICHVSAVISSVIAWIVAVIAAFLTNKPFVFRSNDWSLKVTLPEFWEFVISRLGSGLLETAAIYLLVVICMLDGNIIKVIVSVAVVVLNYITSRFLVFNKKK